MKYLPIFCLLFTLTSFGADRVWLTIYDQNYAVVRDVRSFTLTEGVNEVRFGDISRMILDAPVRVSGKGFIPLEQSFQYHRLGNEFLLQESFGKKVDFYLRDSTWVGGTLVSPSSGVSTFLIQQNDGTVRTVKQNDVLDYRYPSLPKEYQLKPMLSFKLESAAAGTHDVEAAYEVQGLDWDARYLLDLSKDDSSATFSGWAVIKNAAGRDFNHARLTLVSGQPPRQQRRLKVSTDQRIAQSDISGLLSKQPGFKVDAVGEMHVRGGRGEEVLMKVDGMEYRDPAYAPTQHEQLFDLQTYTLPHETDLSDGIEKELTLFPPATIKTATRYEYVYWQSPNKVGVYVSTVNTDSVGLGVPLPAGPVEIHRMRAGNVPEYVGEDRLGAVAEKDRIRFRVGYAEGVTANRAQTKHETDWLGKTEDKFEIRIQNARDVEVTVAVQERFPDKWRMLASSHDYVEIAKNMIEFPVTIPPESETLLTYEVRLARTWERRR